MYIGIYINAKILSIQKAMTMLSRHHPEENLEGQSLSGPSCHLVRTYHLSVLYIYT